VNTRIIARIALFTATAFGLLCNIGMQAAWAASTPPSQPCIDAVKPVTIDGARKIDGSGDPSTVSLGDRIAVKVSYLAADFQKTCTATPVVLYLNGYPMKSLTGTAAPVPAATGASSASELTFELRVTDDSRASWVHILGSPTLRARDITVSVGLEDLYPLPPTAGKTLPQFKLVTFGNLWFAAWVVIFLILLAGFLKCAVCTNIVRDGNPADAAKGVWGTYSLAKSQGAWWFFIILAAYLLIGLVTGDFFNSINSTALILLGIGAGTVIGSAVIDSTMHAQDADKTADAIKDAEKTSTALDTQLQATPEDADLKAKKQAVTSQLRKLRGESESYFKDILSDANGVNFHRFQLMAWTVVLGIIFAKGVYENLAMPEFNTTLMGLLGLSAGTYLGLKIPEAPTPRK
jgi:hypothetical protein